MKHLTALRFAAIASLAALALPVNARDCRTVHWRSGTTIDVNAALRQSTRIQFPSEIALAKRGNQDLWILDQAVNQLVVMPNSEQPEGLSTTSQVFTKDGNAYDIVLHRSSIKDQDICVLVQIDGGLFTNKDRAVLSGVSAAQSAGPGELALQQQLQEAKADKAAATDKAVMEALRRFRYHVYTRYDWSKGKGFAGKNLISDVYDDGRFTYIRLTNPDRGTLSVETVVGGKPAIVPTTYDDAYGMYVIVGIYPEFTLRQDDTNITVTRADNTSRGNNG